MRLVVVIFSLVFGFAFAQTEAEAIPLEACDTEEVISQNVDEDMVSIEFVSDKSIAKCFYSLNKQMNDNGWERDKNNINNVYTDDTYRVVYVQDDLEQMLMLRKVDDGYKVILDL